MAHPLSSLDLAARARTVVAAATDVQVDVAGATVAVPYVDLDGAPLLVVPAGMAALLGEDRLVCLRLSHAGGTSVVLSGSLAPLSCDLLRGDVRTAAVAASRRLPARDGRTALLHLVLDAVVTHDADGPVSLDLETYWEARPQEVLARGWQLARHLNAHHGDDLRALIAGLRRVEPARVAAAEIVRIDPEGMDVRVVDRDGGWHPRIPFGRACASLHDVGTAIAARVAAGVGPGSHHE